MVDSGWSEKSLGHAPYSAALRSLLSMTCTKFGMQIIAQKILDLGWQWCAGKSPDGSPEGARLRCCRLRGPVPQVRTPCGLSVAGQGLAALKTSDPHSVVKRLTQPLACWLYIMVWQSFIPRLSATVFHSSEVNRLPLSEVRSDNSQTQPTRQR